MRNRLPSIAWRTASRVLLDIVSFVSLSVRSRSQLAAVNLFLRKQLGLYAERRVRAHRVDDATRTTLSTIRLSCNRRPASLSTMGSICGNGDAPSEVPSSQRTESNSMTSIGCGVHVPDAVFTSPRPDVRFISNV